jgi:hypothetical protein
MLDEGMYLATSYPLNKRCCIFSGFYLQKFSTHDSVIFRLIMTLLGFFGWENLINQALAN